MANISEGVRELRDALDHRTIRYSRDRGLPDPTMFHPSAVGYSSAAGGAATALASKPRVSECDNETSITIRGKEQVVIAMKALWDAGLVNAQAARQVESGQ